MTTAGKRCKQGGEVAMVAAAALLMSSCGAPSSLDCHARFAGQTVRWIAPSTPGGGWDTYSRLIAPFYGRALGAKVVVENQSGAAGIIGATAIMQSAPDGRTLGMLNGPGLLVAAMTGETSAPNPVTDFTILARVASSKQVWATGATSGLRTLADLFDEANRRPILFGVRDVGGTAFIGVAVGSSLLGLDQEIVAGFRGSRDTTLAAVRGDVDIVVHSFESIRAQIVAGELRLLLQVSAEPISNDPLLDDVPLLGGNDGVAASRAAALGRDVTQAIADASALDALVRAGRLVVAPPELEPGLRRCMEQALLDALTSDEFVAAAAKAHRSIDLGRSEEALAELQAAVIRADRFVPIVRDAILQVRE